MSAPVPPKEPRMQLAYRATDHNTTDVQNLMGVSVPQGSHAERKILDLEILGASKDYPNLSLDDRIVHILHRGGSLSVRQR